MQSGCIVIITIIIIGIIRTDYPAYIVVLLAFKDMPGSIYIRLLKLTILPMIASNIINGKHSSRNDKNPENHISN